ncbi:MAG TPA: hypothetical protein VNE39_19465 [Planctomycetota bacterium]|nr:hypothetical protein [Planctomycetota bacterium]
MGSLATVLDCVFIVAFGAWAYVAAGRKRRDQVGWPLIAAVAFWLPGYLMQDVIFPLLAEKLGWTAECQAAWRKPSAYIVGGLCALGVDLYLTFFVRPAAEPPKQAAP